MRVFAFLVVLVLLCAAPRADAITFDVRALVICPNTTYCPDDDKILRKFEVVNRRFAPYGVAFRPDIERLYDPVYAAIDDWGDAGVEELLDMAIATPERVTFFIIEGSNFKCWAALPQTKTSDNPEAYSLFCYGNMSGTVFAHELGHYFCLGHTHSFQDPVSHSPVDHDGDNLAATPDDPGIHESDLVNSGGADDGPGREWCTTAELPDSPSDFYEWVTEPGYAPPSGCAIETCERSTANGTIPIPFMPSPENGMSYYHGCAGPWTHNGMRHDFFVEDQGERIAQCIADEPERAAMIDVCAGDDDDDFDGLCNSDDACPTKAALVGMDVDSDNDGIVDGCDECPNVPGNGVDTDDDGFCDALDVDDDNDTCKDSEDTDPLVDTMKVGRKIGDRRECSGNIMAWTGSRAPNGALLCQKRMPQDIDGDWIMDYQDDCPLVPGSGCNVPVSCPELPPNWRLVCALGGCNELELVVFEVSNPQRILASSRFQIANDTLYARPAAGQTLLETARTLAGYAPPDAAPSTKSAEATGRLRFEIRKRDGTFVETVAEADVADIRLGPLQHGAAVTLRTDDEGPGVELDIVWAVALEPGAAVADADRDRYMDARDNCTTVANTTQYDADGDGYGNSCDPDLDNDGRKTAADLARLRAALGSVARLPFAGTDRYGDDVFEVPERFVEYAPEADLDGDGTVDANDEKLWSAAQLGPSGVR